MFGNNLFTKLCQIAYPLIQAPMSPLTSPELVASVSNAGGLGTIAAARMTGDQLQREIATVRSLTTKPFGVNLFIPPKDASAELSVRAIEQARKQLKELLKDKRLIDCSIDVDAIVVRPAKELFAEQVEVIFQERIPVFSFTFGCLSKKLIERGQQLDIRLVGTATTAQEAVFLKDNGCDAICLQGSEAGGHRGSFLSDDRDTIEQSTIGLQSLLSQTAQFIDPRSYPLIAAGGLMDGYGLVHALTAGASAVQMGTRFLTCDESAKLVPQAHRRLLLDAKHQIHQLRPTVLTRAYTGKPARGIRTAITDYFRTSDKTILPWQIQSQLVLPLCQFAAKSEQIEFMQLWAGQNYARCEQQPAGEIVQQVIDEARHILNDLSILFNN